MRPNEVGAIHRLAILDFTDAPAADAGHSGRVVAGVVATRALAVKGWSVVEREQLSKVLMEQDLQSTSIVDPATALRLGKIVGADGILVGEVAQYRIGSIPFFFLFTLDQDVYKVDFSFRLISVQTGEICLSAHVSNQNIASFERAVSEGVERVFVEIERQLGTAAPNN